MPVQMIHCDSSCLLTSATFCLRKPRSPANSCSCSLHGMPTSIVLSPLSLAKRLCRSDTNALDASATGASAILTTSWRSGGRSGRSAVSVQCSVQVGRKVKQVYRLFGVIVTKNGVYVSHGRERLLVCSEYFCAFQFCSW